MLSSTSNKTKIQQYKGHQKHDQIKRKTNGWNNMEEPQNRLTKCGRYDKCQLNLPPSTWSATSLLQVAPVIVLPGVHFAAHGTVHAFVRHTETFGFVWMMGAYVSFQVLVVGEGRLEPGRFTSALRADLASVRQ